MTEQAAIDAFNQYLPGLLTVDAPNRMKVGDRTKVTVRVSHQASQAVSSQLQAQGIPSVDIHQIAFGTLIKVDLAADDPKDFSFDSDYGDPAEQAVTPGHDGLWRWDATPQRSGAKKIRVLATPRLAETQTFDHAVDVPPIAVSVDPNPVYSVKSFASTNWQWLLGLVPLGAIGALFRRRTVRRRSRVAPPKKLDRT